MSWKANFSKGMKALREGDPEAALTLFSSSLDAKPNNICIVYDARSSALEKLGRYKEALKDVRKTIELAPDQWQGYLRAARLFCHLRKYPNALVTVDMALDKCPQDNASKKKEMHALKLKISAAQAENIRRTRNHSAILPIELFAEIVHMLLDHDSTSPLRLSHVCQYWRTVVSTNPLFWRTLVLGRNRPHVKAKLWVSRSQGRIRDLRVKPGAVDKGWSGQGLEDIHWGHLRECSIVKWDLCRFLKQSGILAELTSLERYEFISEERLSDNQIQLFAPNWPMQHLALHGSPLTPHFNTLSGDVVRSLVLRNSTGTTPLCLEPFTSLETLILENETRNIASYPLDLNQLQELQIHRVTTYSEKIIEVPMPKLRVLHLRNSPITMTRGLESLACHTSQLTHLLLSSILLDDPRSLVNLLESNPHLEKLEVTKIANGAMAIANGLARVRDAVKTEAGESLPLMCPKLCDLNFSHCPDLRTGPLVRLVGLRNAGEPGSAECAKIQSLIVDGCEAIDAGRLEWFRSQVPTFSCIYRPRNIVRQRR